MQGNLVSNGDSQNLTLVIDGKMYVADNTHPNWDAILDAFFEGDDSPEVADLFDLSAAAAKRFEALGDRVSVSDGVVYFDGDPVHNALTERVVKFLDDGVSDWVPLVNFFEKVMANPNEHSREQLYRWLERFDFSITEDGDFIAYKLVNVLEDGVYGSINTSGKAIVDGEERSGSIRQEVGSIVEMPRSEVNFDPSVGCSTGLHAGTWKYTQDFRYGGKEQVVLKVKINPADVVSVPTDCDSQKLRTRKYEVLEVVEQESNPAVYAQDATYNCSDADGEDYCSDCGGPCIF